MSRSVALQSFRWRQITLTRERGNPSGRAKGCKNFKTLFQTIPNEQIALQDGDRSKKITKGEAIMRRLVIGALKGDSRRLGTLFRLAEQTGQFDEEAITTTTQIIVTGVARHGDEEHLAAGREVSTEVT
jgi:hypothetical protein